MKQRKQKRNRVLSTIVALSMFMCLIFVQFSGALHNTGKVLASTGFSTTLEAELATMSGSVKAASQRAGFSGTGYATGFDQSPGNGWSMTVQIPTTKHYTITIRSAADSYKENYLYINGGQAATIYSGDSVWSDTVITSVYLQAGLTTLEIKESWGWFDLDYIKIEEGEGISDSVYTSPTSSLVNPNADSKTREIYSYLKSIYGNYTLSGQTATLNQNTEIEALYSHTGKYPALRSFDFIFCSPASSWQNSDEVTLANQWDKRGGLTSFQWHWHAPKGGADFYTKGTSFDLSKAVTSYDLSMKTLAEVKTMYDTGLISEEAYLMVRDIDVISGYIAQLQAQGVTILWRPLHEASGGWFWWGAKGPEPYLWLYRLMFERQTNFHQLNNLIWVWNGQGDAWYPGDQYADIVGTDIYAEGFNYSVQSDQFIKTVNYANGNKMAALTENGVMMDPDLMVRDNVYWLWFAVWYGDFLLNSSGQVGSAYTDAAMVRKIYTSDVVLTLDELPTFGQGPTATPTVAPTATPTIAPTATPTVAPTATPTIVPTTTPTIAPTTTPTITPTTPPSQGSLTLTSTNNSWGGGYIMNFTLTNTATTPVTNWKLNLNASDFVISNSWGVTNSVVGDKIVLTPHEYNLTIPAGGYITFGFQGTGSIPSNYSYTIN